jgi:hypothetical protein
VSGLPLGLKGVGTRQTPTTSSIPLHAAKRGALCSLPLSPCLPPIHVLDVLVLVLSRNDSNPFLLATAHTPLRGLTRGILGKGLGGGVRVGRHFGARTYFTRRLPCMLEKLLVVRTAC